MKVKHVLIAVGCGLLVLVLGLITATLTTPLSYQINAGWFEREYAGPTDENSAAKPIDQFDWFGFTEKCGKTMNLAYKINPSQANLDALVDIYSVQRYMRGHYQYAQTAPDGYVQYMVKYNALMYETQPHQVNRVSYVPLIAGNEQASWLTKWAVDYAMALYIDGQTDKSKEIIETNMRLLTDEEALFAVSYYKEYLYFVFSDTEDASLKRWVLDVEAYFDLVASRSEKSKGYQKYGTLFTNPDFKDYISYNWPEFQDGYYD